jgi:MFS family permease
MAVEPALAPRTLDGLTRRLRAPSFGGTFASLGERDYAWYFAGNFAFFMGMQMQMLLRGYLAFELTGSASAIGVMAVSMAVPMLVAAPFGGVIADRINKRTLLITTQAAAAVFSLVLAILIVGDIVEFWHLIVISTLTGFLFSFNMPARQALVPQLVPQHRLVNAVTLQMGGMNLTRILAPAMAGILIAPIGVGMVYVITVVLFLVAVASEFHLPKFGMVGQAQRKSFREDFTAGFRYIMGDPTLRLLMVAALVMPLFGFPVQQMLPVFAEDVFDVGGLGLGFLAAASGLGGLAGALTAANLDSRPAKGRLMFAGGLFMGAFIIAFAAAPNYWVALLFLVSMGVGQMLFQAINNSAIQAELPAEVRGRVMAVLMMSFGLMPLGLFPVTIAADHAGAPIAVACSGGALLVLLVLLWGLSPRLRGFRLEALARTELSPARAAELVASGRISQEEADRLTGEAAKRRKG